jgi:hypothetical protein
MDQLSIPHYCDEALGGDHGWSSGWLGPLVAVLMADDMTKARPVPTPAKEFPAGVK